MIENRQKKIQRKKRYLGLVFLTGLIYYLLVNTSGYVKAATESGIRVKEINYQNSTITLQLNEGDTKVYFSDSQKRTWDLVPGKVKSDNTIVMDLSWISASKSQEINFKGDKTTRITTVVIPKQATSFKVSYDKIKGKVSFGNTASRTIEWRKKGSTVWNRVNTDTISTELSYFYTNGATLYFRLAAVNGTSSTDTGLRPSREVTVTIPKKTAAPAVKIDGSEFSITLSKGTAYRTINQDGTATDWITINRTTDLLLTEIAAKAMYSNSSASQEEVTLQFRKNATSSSQVSNIATVTVPVQEGPPDADKNGISLKYTSSTTLTLQVKAASTAAPYEYAIVKEDGELSYDTAKWTSITSSAELTIKKSTAPNKSHVYVRKKSMDATEEADFSLASVELDVTGVNGVVYPETPKADSLTRLITTAGVCKSSNSSGYLTFTLYSPTETTVSSIDLYDTYGNKKGSVTSKSTVSANANSTGANDRYIITTNITSTESVDSITNETLYAHITLNNTDTITSTENTGIHLYLYPNTYVNNPDEDDYSSDFQRVFMSDDAKDAASFKFKLDFGTDKVMDMTSLDGKSEETTAVSSISFNGNKLVMDTDYTVEYGSYVDSDNKTITTATVVVYVSKFEELIPESKLDQKTPLIIKLNNNEILNDDVSITLVSTAVIDNKPIAWSITEGSLKETKTTKVTNDDGSTSTVTEENITYTINLTVFDKAYEVSVSDVTWGDKSVLGSASVSNGKATVYLSNVKINRLTTDSTDTNNIVIKLSNGFVIRSGCKLTIINADE